MGIFSPIHAQSSHPDYEELRSLMQAHLAQGNPDDAIDIAYQILDYYPYDVQVRWEILPILIEEHRYYECLEMGRRAFQMGVAITPESAESIIHVMECSHIVNLWIYYSAMDSTDYAVTLGELLAQNGLQTTYSEALRIADLPYPDSENRLQMATQLVASDETSPYSHIVHAEALATQAFYNEDNAILRGAIAEADLAIRLAPDLVWAYTTRAYMAFYDYFLNEEKEDSIQEALDYVQMALDIDPTNYEALIIQVILLRYMPDEALQAQGDAAYEHFLNLYPWAITPSEIENAGWSPEGCEQVAPRFHQFIAYYPYPPYSTDPFDIYEFYHYCGFDSVEFVCDPTLDYPSTLSDVFLHNRYEGHFLSLAQCWASFEPENGEALRALGDAYLWTAQYPLPIVRIFDMGGPAPIHNGEPYQSAIEAFSRAIELSPDDAYLYASRAEAYWLLQDYPACVESAEQSLALDPNYVYPLELMVVCSHARGNLTDAIVAGEMVRQIAPANTFALMALADSYLKKDNCEQALAIADMNLVIIPYIEIEESDIITKIREACE